MALARLLARPLISLLFAGLLPLLSPPPPAAAAQQLRLQLDGLQLPIDLLELEAWSRNPAAAQGELAIWLNLLEPSSRLGLRRLLNAPVIRDRSFGSQLLGSWSGDQMLKQLAELLACGAGCSTDRLVLVTLQRLLQSQASVSTIELLRALPVERLILDLDDLLALASQWQQQLQAQRQGFQRLQSLALPLRQYRPPLLPADAALLPRRLQLPVAHRQAPLPLELWPSSNPLVGPWLLLMPGLGGDPEQLNWLAAALAEQGWPVVLLEHPGSDSAAIQDSFAGKRPFPGAESLRDRLADVEAVLAAQRQGALGELGPGRAGSQGVVLMGHSLGGLVALLAAGMPPEPGLASRCARALNHLPVINVSRLLQCQIPQLPAPGATAPGAATATTTTTATAGQVAAVPLARPPVIAVVVYNSFGSLLWPAAGLAPLKVPVLMVGGSLDLITPPIIEQLPVFLHSGHLRSRLVLVQGASHFSPVRLARDRKALFRLGDQLVGIDPLKVQSLLLNVTSEFLVSLAQPLLLSPQLRQQQGINAYVLDRQQAQLWWRRLDRR
ncbi:MAG TPA: alpha/beta hydrolase [Synechococcales bacterium UBA10510]|nr:alpha/beta hydrolase [Synechococcales bacterium UBA10510]